MAKIVTSAPGKVILFGEHAVVYGKFPQVVIYSAVHPTGSSNSEVANQRCLLDVEWLSFRNVFISLSNSMGKLVVSAPGKVILFGEHAVVYKKLAVAVSINLRTTVKVEAAEAIVDVTLPSIGLKCSWAVNELKELGIRPSDNPATPTLVSDESLARLKKFVACQSTGNDLHAIAELVFLALYFSIGQDNGTLPGLKIVASSELPVGGGLGSSAAYSSCLVTCLLYHRGVLPLETRAERGDIGDWTPKELSLINQWAYLAETITHGNPSGIDNSVSTFGGILKFKNGEITPLDGNPGLKILLINTKIARNTKMLVSSVQERYKKYPDVVRPVLDAIGSIAEQGCCILADWIAQGGLPEHFVALEDLISMNQPLLESLGVSHPKLAEICRLANEHGLHAKLTGAGGGGFAFVLVPPYADATLVSQLIQKLGDSEFECWETTLGGTGLRLEQDLISSDMKA